MGHVVTKSDLVQVAAKAGNLSRAVAGEAVNAVFDAIVENVAKGKRVTVVGFGTFLPRKRKARSGRSPVNGKEIRISAKTLPAFAAAPKPQPKQLLAAATSGSPLVGERIPRKPISRIHLMQSAPVKSKPPAVMISMLRLANKPAALTRRSSSIRRS